MDWWNTLSYEWRSKSLFCFKIWKKAVRLFVISDAADSIGLGAYHYDQCFAKWPAEAAAVYIGIKESIPIVLASKYVSECLAA